MDQAFYKELAERSLKGEIISDESCRTILSSSQIELLALLDSAYQVRKKFWGREVAIHILNNAQNGFCPEDCHYCAQAKTTQSAIDEYPLKSEEEVLSEAKRAWESGAFRYCLVFAGRGPSPRRIEILARWVREIKKRYPIEVCISAGLINKEGAQMLKAAGLDRLNHNLNTSQRHYSKVCTTHTFQDRLQTLRSAQESGLELCSGIIVGMGEETEDVMEVAKTLRELHVRSIPVNFLIPIPGHTLSRISNLNPEYCLRVLCLFRFLNPDSELRVAGGREGHLRSLEVMALYPANSLFLDGYLNTKGSSRTKTLQMIKDVGFTIKSEQSLDKLLGQEEETKPSFAVDDHPSFMKTLKELRPYLQDLV